MSRRTDPPIGNHRSRARRSPRALPIACLLLCISPAMLAGCYSRIVDARGIGADSTELRENNEREPRLRDAVTTSRERDTKPPSGVW
ncbi:MAG: hypothetical protein AAFR96_08440 [Planctomycetota bacterium]